MALPKRRFGIYRPGREKNCLNAAIWRGSVVFVHFTPAFAALSPQAFVDDYLVGLKAAAVVAGFDYTYGKRAVASMALLPEYARGRFEVVSVPKLAEQARRSVRPVFAMH